MRTGFLCLVLSLPLTFAASAQSSQSNPDLTVCPRYLGVGQPPPPGCLNGGIPPDGSVFTGSNPVVGAQVYLFEAGSTGYGGIGMPATSNNASVSILTSASNTFYDNSSGPTNGDYYVTTNANGYFYITGDYTCTAGEQVYAYSIGGDAGSGFNSALGELAALGACPSTGVFPYAAMNEVTTIAAAYAMAGFATDALHVSSDSGITTNSTASYAATGIANAFANAVNLASLSTGLALATTPSGTGTVPQTTINSLADILEACGDSSGLTTYYCSTLFSTATSNGIPVGSTGAGAEPTDTATAAINIAHYPGSNITTLFGLITPYAFYWGLPVQPNDFTIGINFTSRGLDGSYAIAIDGAGDVWVTNLDSLMSGSGSVTEFSSSGDLLSPLYGYTATGIGHPASIAIDAYGSAWTADFGGTTVTKFSSLGVPLSPSGGFPIPAPLTGLPGIAIDGFGNAWVAIYDGGLIAKLSNSGSVLSGAGYTGGGLYEAYAVAVDGSNNVWVGDGGQTVSGNVAEFSNSGNPLSGSGYTLPQSDPAYGIATDNSGNAWVTTFPCTSGVGCVVKFSNSGSILSGTNGYNGGGMDEPAGIAIDGSGNVWLANVSGYSITELSNTGTPLSPSTGYNPGSSNSIYVAVDGSGDVWTTGYDSVNEIIGAASPVVTPLAVGVATNKLGMKP